MGTYQYSDPIFWRAFLTNYEERLRVCGCLSLPFLAEHFYFPSKIEPNFERYYHLYIKKKKETKQNKIKCKIVQTFSSLETQRKLVIKKKTGQKYSGKSIIFPVEILEILQVKQPFPVIELFFHQLFIYWFVLSLNLWTKW